MTMISKVKLELKVFFQDSDMIFTLRQFFEALIAQNIHFGANQNSITKRMAQ